jgi:thioredoxin reductase
MEEIIASGQADVVTIGRGLMADPHLPQKARAGKNDEIRPCLRCLTCFSTVMAKHEYNCAVNPEIGFEQDSRYALPQSVKKTILIAGGGAAGMQAALTASQRGHKVILCEKSGRLGGALRCEQNVPFKKHLAEYLNYQARMISRAPVDVRTGTEVTPEFAKTANADVIIAALGSRPMVPHIPGINGKNVLGAEEVYYHPENAGNNVVIIGGGVVGVEMGIYLAGLGRKITIIEMMESLNDGGNLCHGLALNVEIKRYDIRISTGTRVIEINEKGVTGGYVGDTYTLPVGKTVQLAPGTSNTFGRAIKDEPEKGSKKFFPADTVIYAIGQQPLSAEANALRFCAPEFYQIGDCLAAKNIQQATSMAFAIARDI